MNLVKVALDAFFQDHPNAEKLLKVRSRNHPVYGDENVLASPLLHDLLFGYTPTKDVAATLKALIRETEVDLDNTVLSKLKQSTLINESNMLTEFGYCKALELLPLKEQLSILKVTNNQVVLDEEPRKRKVELSVASYYENKGMVTAFCEGSIFRSLVRSCIYLNLAEFESLGLHPSHYERIKRNYPEEYATRIATYYTFAMITTLSYDYEKKDTSKDHKLKVAKVFKKVLSGEEPDKLLSGLEKEWRYEPKLQEMLCDAKRMYTAIGMTRVKELVSKFTEDNFSLGGWPDLIIFNPNANEIFLSEVKYKRDKLRFSQIYFILHCYPKISHIISSLKVDSVIVQD